MFNRSEFVADVEVAIATTRTNYAGYPDKVERFGKATIEQAAQRALRRAATVKSQEEGLDIITKYLQVFQDGHLSVLFKDDKGELHSYHGKKSDAQLKKSSANPTTPTPPLNPSVAVISPDAFLVRVPSFDWNFKSKLDALIQTNDSLIQSRDILIIDLRGNGGGSDPTYELLSPYLYSRPVVNIGTSILATKEVADSWEALLAEVPAQMKEAHDSIQAVVRRIRLAPPGSYILGAEDSTNTFPTVLAKPSRIGIIIDGECASTTEQFLLEARQSSKVVLFGETTAGILDYANVRTFNLASGKVFLGMPTTRSRRLPKDPVDNVGISPNVVIRLLKPAGTPDDSAVKTAVDYLRNH